MGCACACNKIKQPIEKIFHIDIDENDQKTKNEKSDLLFKIKIERFRSFKPDSSINQSQEDSLEEDEEPSKSDKEFDDLISIQNFSNISSNSFEVQIEEYNFSIKVFENINYARKNCTSYSKKIDKLAKGIIYIKNEKYISIPILTFFCNNEISRIEIKDVFPFKETSSYINKLQGSLKEIKFLDEFSFDFYNSTKISFSNKDIQKKLYEFEKRYQGKYKILFFHIIHIDFFDDPEISTMMSLVIGDYYKEMRESIFNKDITHINISTKKLSKNKRYIFYLFAKSLTG